MVGVSETVAAYDALVERVLRVMKASGLDVMDAGDPVRLVVRGGELVLKWEEVVGWDDREVDDREFPVGLEVVTLPALAFEGWCARLARTRADAAREALAVRERQAMAAIESQERRVLAELKAKYEGKEG